MTSEVYRETVTEERAQAFSWIIRLSLSESHPFRVCQFKIMIIGLHACNPSYLGGRDQEDCSSRPVKAKNLQDPILKITNTKKGWQSGSNGKAPA
jgi:hypothetical protein